MQYNAPTGSSDANAGYVGKNLAAGQQGSKIPPTVPELTQREIVAVVVASNQSPTNSDTQQLLKAVRTSALSFYSDSGTADALIITPSPAFTAIPDGAEFAINKLPAAGPNATTTPNLAVNGISRPIVKEDGTAVAPGDLAGLFTLRALGGQFRVVGLRKSDGGFLHIGDDVSASPSQITANVSPSISAYLPDHLYSVSAAHDCPGGPVNLNLDGVGNRPGKRCDGSALEANDWRAGDRLLWDDDGTNLRLVGLTKVQVGELAGSSTTVIDQIFQNSDAGLTHLAVTTPQQNVPDISTVSSGFTQVQGTSGLHGATSARASGECSFRNVGSTGQITGGTMRLALYDNTSHGIVGYSGYIGCGSPVAGAQLGVSITYVFQGLNPAHDYSVLMLCQKGNSDGPNAIWDTSIDVYHNGVNS